PGISQARPAAMTARDAASPVAGCTGADFAIASLLSDERRSARCESVCVVPLLIDCTALPDRRIDRTGRALWHRPAADEPVRLRCGLRKRSAFARYRTYRRTGMVATCPRRRRGPAHQTRDRTRDNDTRISALRPQISPLAVRANPGHA